MNEQQDRRSKVNLIKWFILGIIPMSLAFLMLYYFFISKNYEPPSFLKGIFEILMSSKFYCPLWSEVDRGRIIVYVIVLIGFGISFICYGIYKYWKAKKYLGANDD